MPREQAVILTKRDFRLLPKAKLDALVASTSSTSLFFGSASPRQAQRATREAQLDAVVGKGVEAEEPVENSVCFDLTTGPKLEPRPAGGYSPKPPTRSERILHGSYTTAGSIVPRQQGVSGAAIAKAASSHALTDMELYEQLSRLRTVTTGRNDIFDGGHDTIHALVESLRAVYRHIPVEMVALKALAGATLHSTVASMYFDMQCSSSPRFATAPAGTCRSLEQLTDYSSVSSAMTTGSSTSGIAVSPSCISHKLHAIAVENELLAERERLALLRRQFEEMQHTLRNYEKQAKKEPKCALSSALVVAGKLKNSPQDDPLAVATDSDDESSRLQLAIVENDRLRAALADRDDVISRQSNEIMYLQGKCNDLQKLLSQNMDTTLDFAVKYKQTLERTTGHASPMLLDGKTAEQVAWQSNLDIAKMLGMPIHGIPPRGVGDDRRQSAVSNNSAPDTPPFIPNSFMSADAKALPLNSTSVVGNVVHLDHITSSQRLEAMQHTLTHALALTAPKAPPQV